MRWLGLLPGALTAVWIWGFSASAALADLQSQYVATIEWLVDNSDVIVIERKDLPHGPEAVVRTFKGDPETLSWPIANRQRNPSDGYGQDGQECLRLLFVRGNAELLQDVTLARRPADARSDLEQYFYGVNQYGEVMMTENQLLTAVEARLKTPATPQVALRQGQPKYFWPGTFLLDDGGRTYHFLVPMDQNRRDYYLEKLRTGDALQRIGALEELGRMDDPLAVKGIAAAIQLDDDIPESYSWGGREKPPAVVTAEDARRLAQKILAEQDTASAE